MATEGVHKRARTDGVVLYHDPFSVHSRLVYVIALASNIPVEIKTTHLGKGENRQPAYLALNPTGQLPTLVDGDIVVFESSAVIHYLLNKYQSALYPRDDGAAIAAIETAYEHLRQKPWDTANTISFEGFIKKHFSPHLGEPNAALVAESLAKLEKRLRFIEDHFFKADPHHYASTSLNIADVALACLLAQAHTAKDFSLAAYPKLDAFYASLKANEHFLAVHKPLFDAVEKINGAPAAAPDV